MSDKGLLKKSLISAQDAILFILISHPKTYQLINKILPVWNKENNCPTTLGVFTHTLIFFIANLVLMYKSDLDFGLKIKYSFWGTLLYFLISNKETYKLVNKVYSVASDSGCPNINGIILHAIVYFIALVGVMYFPADN